MLDAEIPDSFRMQITACRDAGSEFTARVLEHCLEDIEAGGPVARLLEDFDGHPLLDALCQRLIGGVQLRLLEGKEPELARLHPGVGGTAAWPATGRAFVAVIAAHADELRPRLSEPVQTNEVGRCAGLLGGFLEIARATRLPLRLLEIGSSAGLNLFWDRYHYTLSDGSRNARHEWGDRHSSVRIRCDWRGPAPNLQSPVRVSSRRGCDIRPLDATQPACLRRVKSFYWADQPERMALLEAAAAALPAAAPVEELAAGDFVRRELGRAATGLASVLFHSTMWWYVAEPERESIRIALEEAGERATAEAPLAWLRSEPPSLEHVEIRLRIWPGGEDRLLGRAHHHGRWVEWLD